LNGDRSIDKGRIGVAMTLYKMTFSKTIKEWQIDIMTLDAERCN